MLPITICLSGFIHLRLEWMLLWCFLLLALEGLGEFPWTHHTERGRFVVGAQCELGPVVAPVTGGSLWGVMSSGDGTSRNRVRWSSSLTALGLTPLRRESGWFVPSWQKWSVSEYPRGLRHQASGREFGMKTHLDHYWIPGRRVTTRETYLYARWFYYSSLLSASRGRDTTTYTVDDDMTRDITQDIKQQTNGLGWSY